MCHGTEDPLILFDWAKQCADILEAIGIPIQFKAYEGLQHSANDTEISDVLKFVSERLKPDANL
jgi:predicted esterase